jgi:putative DNA methylase
MSQSYPHRLIEVDLPIKAISAHARREKSIRHGHISTLHIWWARRPLAACRAVLCAALWPDPLGERCPQAFRDVAALALNAFAEQVRSDPKLAKLCAGHWTRWVRTTPSTLRGYQPACWADLRYGLLDFIADFANWDASTVPAFLETARVLTHVAHLALTNADFQLPKPQSKISNPKPKIFLAPWWWTLLPAAARSRWRHCASGRTPSPAT